MLVQNQSSNTFAFVRWNLFVRKWNFRFCSHDSSTSKKSSPPTTTTPNSTTSTERKTTSSFAQANNQRAVVGGFGKTNLDIFRQKRTYYFVNRSIFTRSRHRLQRLLLTVFSAYRRYYFYFFFAFAVLFQFAWYHFIYRYRYGPDYPITYFDWWRRKSSGTLDPELIKRGEQLYRYFDKRFDEGIND